MVVVGRQVGFRARAGVRVGVRVRVINTGHVRVQRFDPNPNPYPYPYPYP